MSSNAQSLGWGWVFCFSEGQPLQPSDHVHCFLRFKSHPTTCLIVPSWDHLVTSTVPSQYWGYPRSLSLVETQSDIKNVITMEIGKGLIQGQLLQNGRKKIARLINKHTQATGVVISHMEPSLAGPGIRVLLVTRLFTSHLSANASCRSELARESGRLLHPPLWLEIADRGAAKVPKSLWPVTRCLSLNVFPSIY